MIAFKAMEAGKADGGKPIHIDPRAVVVAQSADDKDTGTTLTLINGNRIAVHGALATTLSTLGAGTSGN